MASKGDKVRVTRSTLGRNRKCCCEQQLSLRSTRAARGLGLPRHCQIKRLLWNKTVWVPTFTFQTASEATVEESLLWGWGWLPSERILFTQRFCTVVQRIQICHLPGRPGRWDEGQHVRGFAPTVADTSIENEWWLPIQLSLTVDSKDSTSISHFTSTWRNAGGEEQSH